MQTRISRMRTNLPKTAKDRRHFEAAEGWLGLGDCQSSNNELECMTPEFRAHPDVLRVRFQIYAKAEKWEAAADVARAISELVPESPVAFVQMAYALHKLQRYQDAWNVLIPIADKFPNEYIICYDLACYAYRSTNRLRQERYGGQESTTED